MIGRLQPRCHFWPFTTSPGPQRCIRRVLGAKGFRAGSPGLHTGLRPYSLRLLPNTKIELIAPAWRPIAHRQVSSTRKPRDGGNSPRLL